MWFEINSIQISQCDQVSIKPECPNSQETNMSICFIGAGRLIAQTKLFCNFVWSFVLHLHASHLNAKQIIIKCQLNLLFHQENNEFLTIWTKLRQDRRLDNLKASLIEELLKEDLNRWFQYEREQRSNFDPLYSISNQCHGALMKATHSWYCFLIQTRVNSHLLHDNTLIITLKQHA